MKATVDRKKLNWGKIEKLRTANDMLDDLYGKEGTYERELFKKEAYSYYTSQTIKQVKRSAIMPQTELV